MEKYAKQKGLTLVELLVCMVVIAILALALILSSKEAVSSAKAARIISNLNVLKAAALQWYNDNVGYVESSKFDNLNAHREEIIKKYLSNSDAMEIDDKYQFSDNYNNIGTSDQEQADNDEEHGRRVWFVWYNAMEERKTSGGKKVLEKLGKRGETAKLRRTHTVVNIENKYSKTYEKDKLTYDWQPSPTYYTGDAAETTLPSFIGLHILGDFGKEKIGTTE